MRRGTVATLIVLVLLGFGVLAVIGMARPAAPKAEDDFQLVKVAEGVYAGIAKPGGLASGNAGFIKYKSLAFQNFAQPNVEDMYKELKGTKTR